MGILCGVFCFANWIVLHNFILPALLVREEITKSKFNTMIGLVDRERVDEALYDDFESEKAREVR